ncbi:SAM-dependent methyltransferase [Halobacteriales archaeon QH_7_69_31]|nr:MAG: SAM-dependent methyltransferase [Halobacteriales archaeon QH_7_69_31]
MDRYRVRRLWEDVSATYADQRDPDGSDADLLEDLRGRLPDDPLVVDVGCGDGARTLANLPDGSIGVDFARAGLDLAAGEVPAARLLQGDMLGLPLRTGVADAVTAYHAVFHVDRERHPEVYAEFARVLKPPGGRFETVRRGWMGGSMFFSAPGRGRTLDAIEDAGFEDAETVTADDPLGNSTEFVFARRG